MAHLTPHTLTAAVQAVDSEIRRITETVGGDVKELEPDMQELLLSYRKAATELKSYYEEIRRTSPGLPPYEEVIAAG